MILRGVLIALFFTGHVKYFGIMWAFKSKNKCEEKNIYIFVIFVILWSFIN